MVATAQWYMSKGAPANRLLLGFAAYGHQYTLLNANQYTYPSPSVILYDCSNEVTPSYRQVRCRHLTCSGHIPPSIAQQQQLTLNRDA
jgi:chitinase